MPTRLPCGASFVISGRSSRTSAPAYSADAEYVSLRSTGWMSAARSGGIRSSQLIASRNRVRPEYSAYSGPSCATISGASDAGGSGVE